MEEPAYICIYAFSLDGIHYTIIIKGLIITYHWRRACATIRQYRYDAKKQDEILLIIT